MKSFCQHPTEIQCVCERIGQLFPWLKIDSILDTGSHAKGEANYLSDHDYLILARSDLGILVDDASINNDIAVLKDFTLNSQAGAVCKLPLLSVATQNDAKTRPSWLQTGTPAIDFVVVDTRVCFLNLALEAPMSALRFHWYILTSDVIYDRDDLVSRIRYDLVKQRCFHWTPTIELNILRYLRHISLNPAPTDYDFYMARERNVLRWLVWSLNYLRFAIGVLTLYRNGYYTYRRDDVINFVAANFSQKDLDLILDLYKIKCDPEIRLAAIKRMLGNPPKYYEYVQNQYRLVDTFLERIADYTYKSKPFMEKDRREENAQYMLAKYQQLLHIPSISIVEWLDNCRSQEDQLGLLLSRRHA